MKKRILLCLLALLIAGLAAIGGLFGVVLMGDHDEICQEPDVMVILGALVWPDGCPSTALQARLDKALDYLADAPELAIVVSGGQGSDEPVSEARCMADYLIAAGVDENRILLEENSTNTKENLLLTAELLKAQGNNLEDTHLLVVSSGFHLARVRMLCTRYGLDVSTLGAPMPEFFSRVYSYMRESLALVKSFLFD